MAVLNLSDHCRGTMPAASSSPADPRLASCALLHRPRTGNGAVAAGAGRGSPILAHVARRVASEPDSELLRYNGANCQARVLLWLHSYLTASSSDYESGFTFPLKSTAVYSCRSDAYMDGCRFP
jgi:hypothetical protein